jgi:hypothetical protein
LRRFVQHLPFGPLLGVFALIKLPIQLFPNIEEPVISIFTSWRAAAPTEIESEIIEPQERALAGLRGMQSLNAFANAGSAFLNLQFAVGTDMQATMLEVISRMNQLPPLPRDAQAPQISLGADGGNGPNNTLSWFFVQLLPGRRGPSTTIAARSRVVSFADRIDSGRRQRAHQLRLPRGTADRVRPGARLRARYPDPAHRAGGGQCR